DFHVTGVQTCALPILKDLSREEIIKRFASMEFNRFLDYYANIEDPDAGTETAREERYATGVRIFINLGKMDGLDRSGLIEVIDRSEERRVGNEGGERE